MSHPISGAAIYRRDLPLAQMAMPALIEGGVCDSKVPLQLTPHSHTGFEIHCFASGTMDVCLPQGVQLSARGGEVMIVQPGVSHHGHQHKVLGSQHVWLVIDPLSVSGLSRQGGNGWTTQEGMHIAQSLRQVGNRVLGINLRAEVRQIFKRMKACDQEQPFAAARLRLACQEIILAVVAGLQQDQKQVPPEINPTTIEALAIIQQHLDSPLAVETIAERVGISASRFHQRFLRDTGETPAAYYLRLRCQRAAECVYNPSPTAQSSRSPTV